MARLRRSPGRRVLQAATICCLVLAAIARFSAIVPTDVRGPVIVIMLLSALGSGLGLFADPLPHRIATLLFIDDDTIVRLADERDGGRIVDTIDAVVVDEMGWLPEHRAAWAMSTEQIPADRGDLFVICRVGDELPIGVVTLAPSPDSMMFHVGMWMGPKGRGEGHMRRALSLLTSRLQDGGLSFIADTAVANIAAHKSLEGAGFEQIGSKRHRLPNGNDVDALIFARYAQQKE